MTRNGTMSEARSPRVHVQVGGADLKKGPWSKAGFSDAAPRVDRLPPHSPEAEQGVLGCIFLEPKTCAGECAEKLESSEAFYDLRNKTVYEFVQAMVDKGDAVDIVTLQQRLKDAGQLEAVGGIAYLAALPDTVPSAANLSYYLGIVAEKHTLRKMITFCTEAVGRAYEWQGEVPSLLDEFEREALAVAPKRSGRDEAAPSLVKKAIAKIEQRFEAKGKITGLSTGLADLDALTDGLQRGDFWVLAGDTSSGKTSLAMNIAEHVACDLALPVAVFSFEMTGESLMVRMICARGRVNLQRVKMGDLVDGDFPKITAAACKIKSASLTVVECSGETIGELRAKGRRLWQTLGTRLFVIDYLQLVGGDSKRRDVSRQEEVALVSRQAKALAMETGAAVLALSQVNDDGKLRESRAIGHDGDFVGVLNPTDGGNDEAEAVDLFVSKNRNGPRKINIPLVFLKGYTRFEARSKVSDSDVPYEQ